jgi:bifunctional non-homologous end joining protein LigD
VPAENNAILTEDHALAYRHFEGVIPDDEYSAGTVMIWDEGTYTTEVETSGARKAVTERTEAEAVMRQGLHEGNVTFRLAGKKLHGSFTLIRMRGTGDKATWLLLKHRDEYAERGTTVLKRCLRPELAESRNRLNCPLNPMHPRWCSIKTA